MLSVRVVATICLLPAVLFAIDPAILGGVPVQQSATRLAYSTLLSCFLVLLVIGAHRTRVLMCIEDGYIDLRGLFTHRRIALAKIFAVRSLNLDMKLIDEDGRSMGRVNWLLSRSVRLQRRLKEIATENRARARQSGPGV